MSDWLTSILLGIIEGITEFLPISSTGHLLVPQQLGWLEKQSDVFNIAIQGGAVVTLQASTTDTYTDQGATAVASDGTTLSVAQSGDTVNLAQITGGSPFVIVFCAVDALGILNSAPRTVHVVDVTNPTITA